MPEQEEQSSNTNAVYMALAIGFSLLVAIATSEAKVDGIIIKFGVISRIFMFILGVPGGYLGIKAGRWVRDALMPDIFITTGAIHTAKTKLFWAFVPQGIGLFSGIVVGISPIVWLVK